MHWTTARKKCDELGLDTTGLKGVEFIELLDKLEKQASPALIGAATEEDLASVGLDAEGLRIDKLRSELNSLRVTMRVPANSRRGKDGGLLQEVKFGGKVSYTIDREEETIHFLGNCLGPICTTLKQPDRMILGLARRYLGTFTWDARTDKHAAGMGWDGE